MMTTPASCRLLLKALTGFLSAAELVRIHDARVSRNRENYPERLVKKPLIPTGDDRASRFWRGTDSQLGER